MSDTEIYIMIMTAIFSPFIFRVLIDGIKAQVGK
jgi:hypothetical protein